MKSALSANSFARGTSGAVMAETAIIMPLLLICMFGAIDLGMVLWQWNLAAKATHFGARAAIVLDPVATGVQDQDWINVSAFMGDFCQSSATGNPTADPGTGSSICESRIAYCHGLPGDSSGVCCAKGNWDAATQTCSGASGDYAFSAAAFDLIFDGGEIRQGMREIFPDLRREHVVISYASSGLGFVGHPYGQPMVVTVGIRCRAFDMVLLDTLLGLVWGTNPCGDEYGRGLQMPPFRISFSGEDMSTSE